MNISFSDEPGSLTSRIDGRVISIVVADIAADLLGDKLTEYR